MRDRKYFFKLNLMIFTLVVLLHTYILHPKPLAKKSISQKVALMRSVPTRKDWAENSSILTVNSTVRNDNRNVPWKNIVFWTTYFGERNLWEKVFKRLILGKCEESRCHINLNAKDVENADAIVFNGNDLLKEKYSLLERRYEGPKHSRRPEQIYVFFSMEAPPLLQGIKLQDYDNYFNWTMTFRNDSDVVVPYGKVTKRTIKRAKDEIPKVTQEELSKKQMGVWMVSHCPTQSKREDFVKDLRKYIPVDSYGTCGSKKCGTRTTIPNVNTIDDDPCSALLGNYSFYMALENSLCVDYVTEKLYRSLKLGIIPVVLGAVNYSLYAPPNSYIDSKEFTTYIDLANHLKKVASEANLYNEYFEWQEDYDVELGSPYSPFICDLCKKLHDQTPNSPRKTYRSIRDWYVKKGPCYKFSAG